LSWAQVARDQVALGHGLVAVVVDARQFHAGIALGQLRGEAVHPCAITGDPAFVDARIDLCQQGALFDPITDFHGKGFELAGELCADIDIGLGADLAKRRHRVLDAGALHRGSRGRDRGWLAVAKLPPGEPGNQACRNQQQGDFQAQASCRHEWLSVT